MRISVLPRCQLYYEISGNFPKEKAFLKPWENMDVGDPTCRCFPTQTSFKIPVILYKLNLNCGPPSKLINKSVYA